MADFEVNGRVAVMENAGCLLLHVEICKSSNSSLDSVVIEEEAKKFIFNQDEIILGKAYAGKFLQQHVDFFRVHCDSKVRAKIFPKKKTLKLVFYVYQSNSIGAQLDSIVEESGVSAVNWTLPNNEFEGLWESLVVEHDIKNELMNYMLTSLAYSESKVSPKIVSWNGLVLLHGPPGTGKTSLCKALAHKLSIRLGDKYNSGLLVEINTNSLYSKWYSESSQNVFQMFNSITQWLDSGDHFVCLLINEVESLTHSRLKIGSEPAESLRVVNTILTQIDHLQRYKNLLILTTSNLSELIDVAFADRADIKLYLGYPDMWGVYEILYSCIEELIRCNLIENSEGNPLERCAFENFTHFELKNSNQSTIAIDYSRILLSLSEKCVGLSGRTLRKIPFLTSTKFVGQKQPTVGEYLSAMRNIILDRKEYN